MRDQHKKQFSYLVQDVQGQTDAQTPAVTQTSAPLRERAHRNEQIRAKTNR